MIRAALAPETVHEEEAVLIHDQHALSGNQKTILDIVRRGKAIPRSAIADQTELTQQSVHRLVDQLLEDGLVTLHEGEKKGPGKPSPIIRLNPEASHSIGVLANTDSVVICIVDLTGATVRERRLPMDMTERSTALARIRGELDGMLKDAGLDIIRCCGMGFTMPGYFVGPNRAFNAPEPLRDWSLVDLRPELQEVFGLDVLVENSATAGAIGEALNGVGKRFDTFAYLAFDYGFGGGIILNGAPLTGANGNAGEFSTIYMDPDEQENRPALRGLVKDLEAQGITLGGVEDLRQNFDPRWPGVEDWITRIMPQLNRIVVGLHGILDPQAIVFGGQIPSALAELLIPRVQFPLKARYDTPWPRSVLVKGEAVGEPAATGAALMVLKSRFFL